MGVADSQPVRGDQRWDETWHRLRDWTNGHTPAERLAAQILLSEGYTELDPSHPLGGQDVGADALVEREGEPWVMAAYVPRGQQTYKTISDKFTGDFAGVEKNDAHGMAFVTNQELRLSERRDLLGAVDGPAVIYHLERVVAILDQPKMYGVRHQFLGIQPPPAGELDASERLAEMHRASIARCAARWLTVGLSRDEARALAEDPSVSAPIEDLLPDEHDPVVVWTAPMGSGKSIASERYHQAALEAAAATEGAPVPVFLPAAECVPSLRESVTVATEEVGQPRVQGAHVVVDGVDEVGHQVAAQLLRQARVLTGTWPSTTVLLTSRPVPVLNEAPEHRPLPPLDAEQQNDCVAIGAGEEVGPASLHSLPEPVRATLGQPLFALLTGVWMRDRSEAPRAPIDLMVMLGERAGREPGLDQAQLRALAVRSVERDLAPIPPADVLAGAPREPLLATGMVTERAGGVAFVLPALAQWFAAQALLLEEVAPHQLLEVPEDLELWRYPLGLALALGSADQAAGLLRPVLAVEAGFALRVLETAFGQAILGGATPPSWREGGRQIRQALQALADALGPLAPLVADTDQVGQLGPMAVGSGERHLTVAFWHGDDDRPEVFALPADFDLFHAGWEWGTIRSSEVGPGAAWAWNWSMTEIRQALDRVVRGRWLPLPLTGHLAEEEVWATGCDLVDQSILVCDALDLEPLRARLGRVPDESYERGPVVAGRAGAPKHDLRGLRHHVRSLSERGHAQLRSPLPTADLQPSGGSIGEFFSDERLLQSATQIYERAIVAYRQLVERWMPTLSSRLEHYILMPMRVVGYVSTGRGNPHPFGAIPHIAGYIEALPEESDDEVSMKLSDDFDYSVADAVFAQRRAARPLAARWLTGTIGGMSFELGGRYPVSDVVYRWIAHDLKRLGLVGTLARIRSNDAFVSWDLD